ncbi:hypothetical protein A616_17380 [Brevibacillus brevis X23]|nr:hypothetical protein A616_17380 [Brevibacillus brevis X23]
MSRLEKLSADKLTVMKRILSSQDICKALKYSDTGFLDQPDIEDTSSLIYEQVFPYKKIPDFNKDKTSFITLSFNKYRPIRNSFKSGVIYIHVLVHQDLMKTDYGVLRTDYLITQIDKLMNSTQGIGIGKVEFFEMDELNINEKYMGIYIAYRLVEFN